MKQRRVVARIKDQTITIRIDSETKSKVVEMAQKEHRTYSQQLLYLVDIALKAKENAS
jgi:predicted transcriptional regulator